MVNSKRIMSLALSATVALTASASLIAATKINYVKNATVKYAIADDLSSIDTAKVLWDDDISTAEQFGEGLTRIDKDSKPIPGVATSWKHSADYKTWTFTLRKNAKWSNGITVTAKDFVFGWQRVLDPALASEYASSLFYIKNAEAIFGKKAAASKLGVKALDNYTVQVQLTKPTVYFDALTAFPTFYPVNEKFYNAHKSSYANTPQDLIYNGAFTINKWTHKSEVVLKKNPKYWNASQIKIGTLEFPVISDSNTEMQQFLTKNLDMARVQGIQRDTFTKSGYKLSQYNDGATFYLGLNTKDKVLKNKKIRQALSYAVDRADFAKTIERNDSTAATGFVNPLVQGFGSKSFRDLAGDLINENDNKKKAKSLLAAGMKELGITKLDPIVMIVGPSDVAKLRGEAIAGMFKKNLGIAVDVQSIESKTLTQRETKGDYQISFHGWSADYNDSISFLELLQTGNQNNNYFYSNPKYDSLLNGARTSIDAKKRADDLVAAEKILVDDTPIAPVYFRIRDYALQPNLKGVVRRGIGGSTDFYWAYVAK